MSKTKNTRKLELRRDTLRSLTEGQLNRAQGGFNPQPDPPGSRVLQTLGCLTPSVSASGSIVI